MKKTISQTILSILMLLSLCGCEKSVDKSLIQGKWIDAFKLSHSVYTFKEDGTGIIKYSGSYMDWNPNFTWDIKGNDLTIHKAERDETYIVLSHTEMKGADNLELHRLDSLNENRLKSAINDEMKRYDEQLDKIL